MGDSFALYMAVLILARCAYWFPAHGLSTGQSRVVFALRAL